MKTLHKGIFAGIIILVLAASSVAAVLPPEQNCDKSKAFSLSSNIETGTIRVYIQNNSVCKYQGFLTVAIGECLNPLVDCTNPTNLKSKLGPFIKLFTFQPKSSETYTITQVSNKDLKPGAIYYLIAYIEENNDGEAGFEFAKYLKEFVYGQL